MNHLGDLVNMQTEEETTVEYVINKIKLHKDREKEENQN